MLLCCRKKENKFFEEEGREISSGYGGGTYHLGGNALGENTQSLPAMSAMRYPGRAWVGTSYYTFIIATIHPSIL